MTAGPPIPGPDIVHTLADGEAKYQGEIAPGVYAFGSERPMGRIRAYSAAGLTPFAGRGAPREFHLTGHIHMAPDGKVLRVEGFNGGEGERWAKQAHAKLVTSGGLAEGALLIPMTPLRQCPHTGIR